MQPFTPNAIVQGSLFPEPVRIKFIEQIGENITLLGQGVRTGSFYQPTLTPEQAALLKMVTEASYDGDPLKFRLGVDALRLKFAYEYNPYFSLSIARIDPLPHQLEAVYEYFMKQRPIRFLLADDPGAGKTIMAGLLLKELKLRGLVKRILIVTPANLTFQWKREMEEKFQEKFEIVGGAVLRESYGQNPWHDRSQAITSLSWISRISDAKESLLRSRWDLVIVDEAHKMSAYSEEKKTLAFQIGEALSEMTDHYLLMTATPHKGDPKNFTLFLSLLDRDVYGDVVSLENAIHRREAPFYLRRVKEAMITFPDPATGASKKVFTKREVRTAEFIIDDDEFEFYRHLTRYVEDRSEKAAQENSARGRAIGFTMAMLQRRFASSLYAARRSLERMQRKREHALNDPKRSQRERAYKDVPDDFDEWTEDEQQKFLETLEDATASFEPAALRAEIDELARLIAEARQLEERGAESKLRRLHESLTREGVFGDAAMKLLIFTEHKDTLDYLAGDGQDGRPLGKLREWGLTVTQIHGQMPVGDRNTPGTRIYAEWEFKETCQVMAATEAAGEGINLQFCWLMINYDIPWNPVRLEQRMGRIHRYGQEKDCLIFNFVATNTREGNVLQKLFDRVQQIEDALDPQRTGQIFNVLGDIFPANELERMIRKMYARNMSEEVILSRIVENVDLARFRRITQAALEGLAKKNLNLAVILGKQAEAKARRLVPEAIEQFFAQAARQIGLTIKETKDAHIYRVGRIPRSLKAVASRQEERFGRLGAEYTRIVFDKAISEANATLEWVTPGHPLFEAVRAAIEEQAEDDLRRGAIFYDFDRAVPARLDLFAAKLSDGNGNMLHERLFVAQSVSDGTQEIRQPEALLTLLPAVGVNPAALPDAADFPTLAQAETFLSSQTLTAWRDEVSAERAREIERVGQHLESSLTAILARLNYQGAELLEKQRLGSQEAGLEGRIKQIAERIDETHTRLEKRREELQRERHCIISDIRRCGSAWVLPHPERRSPNMAGMARDDEIERVAVNVAIAHEEAQGRVVERVETQNLGFDLISRLPHPDDPALTMNTRHIEVKGRAGVGEIALTRNEYEKAQLLQESYWLYVVFNCAATPELRRIQNPARLGWQPIITIEHYHLNAKEILSAEKE